MAQTQVYGGYIYEQQPDGSWKRARPAEPQMPADPSFPYEGPKAAADATNAQVQASVNARTADAQISKAQSDAQKAAAEAALAQKNLAKGPERSATEIELASKQQGEQRRAQTISGIMGEVRKLYNQDIKGQPASRLFGALEWADGLPKNERFRAAANNILPLIRPLVAQTAKEGDSDKEMEVFLSYIPHNDDSDITIEQKFKQLEMLIGGMVDGVAPSQTLAGGQRDDAATMTGMGNTPQGGTGYGSANPTPPPFSPGDPKFNISQGTRTVEDPAMKRVAGQYRQMLGENRPAGEILGMLREAGASPQTLMAAMAQIKYRAENPQVPLDKYSITATQEVPLSAYEEAMTSAGSGSAGAFALGAGNFLSGNNLDSLSGDPERARLALQMSQAQNPTAFGVGEVAGGVMAGLSGEAALARLNMAPGLLRGIAADGGMGAINGAGMADEGNRLTGALGGAATAAIGSGAGQLGTRAVGNMIAPTGGNLAGLYASGVRPTPGQRFADSNIAGRALNATEEALQSVPLVGAAVQGARQGARDQFQLGAFNEALKEVGEQLPKGIKPGTRPHEYSQKVFDRVYSEARAGMRLVVDEEMANDLAGLAQSIGTLAEPTQRRFRALAQNIVFRRAKGGQMNGAAYKVTHSELGKEIRKLRGSPSGDWELAEALEGLQGILDNTARRHSPQEAVSLLDAADAGYAKRVRIEQAASRAGGDAGTFSPTGFERAVQKEGGGIRSKAFLRGDALMQDYAEQGKALVDRMPNSGTTDRALQAGGLGAAAGAVFDPTIATTLGGIGALYAPGVRNVTTGAMAPSGATARRIAERLRKRARLIGSASASTGVALLPGTSLGQ